MGAIKDNNYTEKEFEIAHLFDAFGHPARKRMIDLLSQYPFCRNTDLALILNLSPTAIMNHTNKLKRAKLVNIHYKHHHYEIVLNPKRLNMIVNYIEGLSN